MAPLALDTSAPIQPLLGHLGLIDCRVAILYLFAGATDAQGRVPKPVATPADPAAIAAVHGAGLSVMLCANNFGWSDTTGPGAAAAGVRKANEDIAAAEALGYAKGCIIAADFEDWAVDPACIYAWCKTIAAAGYRPALYGSADGAWRGSWEVASARWAVCACPCWTARYVGAAWDGTEPTWAPEDDGGANTWIWQFTDRGPQGVDLSEVHPALLAKGVLWAPATPAPAVTPAPGVNLAEVLAELRQVVAQLQTAGAS
ncbi:MAG: glycoside hydrolase domain-containing protein [Steroidobacteraceae bacterium]